MYNTTICIPFNERNTTNLSLGTRLSLIWINRQIQNTILKPSTTKLLKLPLNGKPHTKVSPIFKCLKYNTYVVRIKSSGLNYILHNFKKVNNVSVKIPLKVYQKWGINKYCAVFVNLKVYYINSIYLLKSLIWRPNFVI